MSDINKTVGLLVKRTVVIDYATMRKIVPHLSRINWYSALDYLKHFKSVIYAEWTNTTSSAGDWDGFIVQHINHMNYLIPISQENRSWHGGGYDLYLDSVRATWPGEFNKQDAEKIYIDIYERSYA